LSAQEAGFPSAGVPLTVVHFFAESGPTDSRRFAGSVSNQDRNLEISDSVQLRHTYNQKSEAEGICMTILCVFVASLFTSLTIGNPGIKDNSMDGQFAFPATNRTVSSLFKQSISH
jgi:hypothetical protein